MFLNFVSHLLTQQVPSLILIYQHIYACFDKFQILINIKAIISIISLFATVYLNFVLYCLVFLTRAHFS